MLTLAESAYRKSDIPKTEKTTNGRLPELSNLMSPPAERGLTMIKLRQRYSRYGVGEPWLRRKQPFVDQRRTLSRRLGGKDAHLTVLHLAREPAALAGTPDGVLPFFRAVLIHDSTHQAHPLVLEQAVRGRQHDLFIPESASLTRRGIAGLAAFHLHAIVSIDCVACSSPRLSAL